MALTQEQINLDLAFKAVKSDVKSSKIIDIRKFGVKLNSSSISEIASNTNALISGFSSGEYLRFPSGHTVIDGTFTINDRANIYGNISSVIRQKSDVDTMVINNNGLSGSSQGQISIEGLSFYADTNMTNGTALKILNGASAVNASLVRLVFTRPDLTKEFKRAIFIENPNECDLRDIRIFGNNTSKLVGVEFGCTKAAISTTLDNVKVYDAQTGFLIRSATIPGIEGLKFRGCDAVGVYNGLDAKNTANVANYVPPGLQVHQSHFNASNVGIIISGYCQADISECILYGNGSGTSIGIALENVSDTNVINNKIYAVGTGGMYGVSANNGNCTGLKVNFNQMTLKAGGPETGIWFGPNTSYSQALYNTTTGLTAGFDVYNQSGSNTVVGNTRR